MPAPEAPRLSGGKGQRVDETGGLRDAGFCETLKAGLSGALAPVAEASRAAFGEAWLVAAVIVLPLLAIAVGALALRAAGGGGGAPFPLAVARAIDAVNDRLGRATAWLTLVMVLVTVLIVVLRYGFQIGFIWMQESVRFMHAAVFLLCAAYTLLRDEHVRVDVFYLKMGARGRAAVDLAGTLLFLIPVCAAIVLYSGDYVLNSWAECEGSLEERGVHAVYLLKTCIWLFAATVILQGVSRAAAAAATLAGPAPGGAEAPARPPHGGAA